MLSHSHTPNSSHNKKGFDTLQYESAEHNKRARAQKYIIDNIVT